MRLHWLTAAILIAALTLASACGDDSDNPASDATPEASGNSNGGDGSSSGDGGSGDAADIDLGDFPVPLPNWAEAVVPDLTDAFDVVLFVIPLDQQQATIAFYEDWTGNQSDAYLRTDSDSGGVTFQSDVEAGEKKVIISILAPLDGDEIVSVSLTRGVLE